MSNNKQQTEVKQIKKYLELPHRETVISTNTIQTKPFDNQKINMSNNKQSSVKNYLLSILAIAVIVFNTLLQLNIIDL